MQEARNGSAFSVAGAAIPRSKNPAIGKTVASPGNFLNLENTVSTRAHCDVPWVHSPAGEKSHAPGTSRLSEAGKESSLERLQAGKQRNEAGI
jgi:hypothetical protein